MAFHQPQQRPKAQRQVSFTQATTTSEAPVPASPLHKRTLEDSQEWILFSPRADSRSATQTSQTARTAVLSDLDSLETHVRSEQRGTNDNDATCQGTETDDDGAELDSLDDGLHAFHHAFSASSPHMDQSGGTVLPTHDGLGAFPSTFASAGMQEQLWQFERYNPHRRRHVRRRSSVQKRLDAMEEDDEVSLEDERTARVEKWRLEQSRAVLDEIERETRRRRRRMSRMSGAGSSTDIHASVIEGLSTTAPQRQDSVMFDEPAKTVEKEQSESFWQRITRRVIQDLMGLDESTLSVIFGEELPADLEPTPTQPSPIAAAAAESRVTFHPGQSWERRLLERIARELGILVHQLSEHEGAFSTYTRGQEEPSYAGLPVTEPREVPTRAKTADTARRQSDQPDLAQSDALFTPTLPQSPLSPTDATDTSLWGIEEEPAHSNDPAQQDTARQRQEQDYWERDVDVRMIFSYLRRRFSSSTPQPSQPDGPLPASWATTTASALGTSPESLRRAEIIRRQHPLVSRAADRAAAQNRRRESLLKRHHMHSLMQRRPGSSSCASQSTKRTRHSRSGSSRNYWDLGGSVGSVGSGPALSSALGGWGEV